MYVTIINNSARKERMSVVGKTIPIRNKQIPNTGVKNRTANPSTVTNRSNNEQARAPFVGFV